MTEIKWCSLEPIEGKLDIYEASSQIETAFQNGLPSIYLPNSFNATVFLTEPFHQNTPAIGGKPAGYRSVIKGTVGQTFEIYFHSHKHRWYTTPPDYDTQTKNITIEEVQFNPPVWQWCDLEDHETKYAREKNWHNYSEELNSTIETAYTSHQSLIDIPIGVTQYIIHSFTGSYAIQENTHTHIKRRIRRGYTEYKEVTLPEHLQDESCALCMESFVDTPTFPTRKTVCGHTFHYTCINGYKARETYNPTCPMCRGALSFLPN